MFGADNLQQTHYPFNMWVLRPTAVMPIDPTHKSHNAPVSYPTMHHFVTAMYTHVHITFTKWCIVRYLSDTLWDLRDWSITLWILYILCVKKRETCLVNKVRWCKGLWNIPYFDCSIYLKKYNGNLSDIFASIYLWARGMFLPGVFTQAERPSCSGH